MGRKRKERQYRKSFQEQWNMPLNKEVEIHPTKKLGDEERQQEQWDMPCDSSHHIRPWSRSSDDRGENKVKVNETLHQKLHSLFINRTPEECIEFLLDYFFGGRVEILKNVLKKKGYF